mmetsp:Transcript_31827/g.64339  ORF Transcript_31827/g.64339 Transcript_31827/m.64339 type:complete len:1966 (-) Transcript_31827:24-5921(-)
MAAASTDCDDNGGLTSQFQLLIQRSCSLLHHFDGLNWNVVKPSQTDGHSKTADAAGDNDNEAMNGNEENDDDDQSDSSSDDGMMMFGGGLLDSDSDNEDDLMMMDSGINDANEQDDYYEEEEDGEEEEEEDDAAMLKRASSVHVALLTSLSPTSFVKDGRDLVQTLVSSILSSTSTTKNDDEDLNKLITTISSVLLKSSNDYLPKRMSDERKRKIGLTNSLLAVQYLLHLLDTSSTSVSSTSSSLLGWKVVILPLLFNTTTTKSFNDTLLQTALLNLISPSSIKMTQDQLGYCQDVCQLCVLAVDQLTSTTAAGAAAGAVTNNHSRQSQLVLVCDVLIRLYDGMNKLLGKQQQRGGGGEELELPTKCVDSVANAIHLVIVKVIRGICYAQVEQDCGGSNKEDNQSVVLLEPLLSLEAVRPVTGMLLPKLYPSGSVGSGNLKEQQQQTRAVELWNEILLLLSPYSEEVVSFDKRKCCRNWESVAPMTATAILCILLPSFRGMELPTVPATGDNNDNHASSTVCRPVFQPSVWALIRQSLKRCGDTDSFGGDGGDSGGRGTSLLSRGARDGGSSTFGYDDDVSTYDRAAIDQLLRRRSAHILRLLIEYERDTLLRSGSKKKGKGKGRQGKDNQDGRIDKQKRGDMWMKYVLCFEMLEMEIEIHLVDQVWTTVKELSSEASNLEGVNDSTNELPLIVWEDVASLLCRVLLSDAPTLRKLGLYRFLCGDSGIQVTSVATEEDQDGNGRTFMRKAESKCKVKKKSGGASVPITTVSVSFVLDIVMRSYDSIVGTKVGTNMQIDEGGQQKSEKVADLLSEFLSNYVIALAASSEDGSELSEFMTRILAVITTLKWRSLVLLFRAVATAVDQSASHKYTLEQETVRAAIKDMLSTFSSGGAPRSLQEGLRQDLSSMLKNAVPWTRPDASIVLDVLSLYPPQDDLVDNTDNETHSLTRSALATWIVGLGDGQWANNAAPVCASAYVMGEMLPFNDKIDILSGVNTLERTLGMAISLLCTLTGNASEMLWPAIFKGLQKPPSASSHKAIRSMILLEWGCREEALSGMGNGDIVTDKQNCMLPPPPNVEFLLNHAVQLLMSQVMEIKTSLGGRAEKSGATRSQASGQASSYIYTLINQIRVLHLSFPSSSSISLAVNAILSQCADSLKQPNSDETDGPIETVVTLTLCYASLSCDAKFEDAKELEKLLSICEAIMTCELSQAKGKSMRRDAVQALRSIFHYAKWGSLSLIVPMINEAARKQPGGAELASGSIQQIYEKILTSANEAVDSTPVIALPPLFACTTSCGEYLVELEDAGANGTSLLSSIKVISETLFAVLKEETASSTWMHMLSSMCNLLFSPKLLLHEYQNSYVDGDRDSMPVMESFEKLIEMGSALKPHINIVAVSYISVAWLGNKDSSDQDVGLAAIPYRDNIAELLVYKEPKFDESSANQNSTKDRHGILPQTTDGSSITRAFVLSFLSKLPSPENMSDVVLKELVHHIILKLIDACCLPPAKGKPFITGSEEYSKMMRSWQALCLLSRFVTSDIANEVAQKVFKAMSNLSHGQIRYFMECFTVQCTRKHPSVFGQSFITEIRRNDLSLQYVSSLMIIGGNLTVGSYSNDFFHSKSDKKIKEILCGVLPWLSSTQGFSRAIAQLLVYKLIPLVVDVENNSGGGAIEKDDAVLRSVYLFLQQNQDMSRVRVKQQSFFDSYDVDTACQFEGLLAFEVDDGDEASPVHMVDAIKECLADVYKEVHDEDAPEWKQMEDLLISAEGGNQDESVPENDELVNFQRKILPVDALDLRIQSLHENKKFNAAGNKKQGLIVCATLVDKVPNLAGLARTAEIFAAETLVLPNTLVKKQDDFKSISASANDWIDMEECKEENLLVWLHKKKAEGYTIVGLEQTSSSKCLTRFNFPDKVVLLLGKEKEGIPVEFLSAVDQCIEIPQLGIIRSLNVHVSGALTIWEYTSQMMKRNKR